MRNKGTGMSFYMEYLKDKNSNPLIDAEAGAGKAGTILEYLKDTNLYIDEQELRDSALSYSSEQYKRVSEYQKCMFCNELHQNIKIYDKSDNSLIENLELLCSEAYLTTPAQDFIFDKLTNENEYLGKNELLDMIEFCNRNQLHLENKILMQLLSLRYRRI